MGGRDTGGSAFGPLGDAERRRLGRLGAALMIFGSVLSLPAGLVLAPAHPLEDHLIAGAGIATGLMFYRAPWERMQDWWLHLVPLFGTVAIACGVAVFSDDYAFYYVLVAIYAAYALRDVRAMVVYATVLMVALLAPLVYAEGTFREQAHHILVAIPALLIAAATVGYLRATLESRERQYREFAAEAVGLAGRIRRGETLDPDPTSAELERALEDLRS